MNTWLLPVSLVVLLCACKPTSQIALGADIAHANGLVAAPPEGFEAHATESGFEFIEAGSVRSPQQIRLDLRSAPPDVSGLRRRGIFDGGVRFVVRDLGGGSGGTEYELTAVRSAGSHYIVLTALVQSEMSPDFSAAWATLDHAAVE